jgi:hypothetical protein
MSGDYLCDSCGYYKRRFCKHCERCEDCAPPYRCGYGKGCTKSLLWFRDWAEAHACHYDSKTGWRREGRRLLPDAQVKAVVVWWPKDYLRSGEKSDLDDAFVTKLYAFEDTVAMRGH